MSKVHCVDSMVRSYSPESCGAIDSNETMSDDSCSRTVAELCDYVCSSTVCKIAVACGPPVRIHEYGSIIIDLVVISTIFLTFSMSFVASIEL